MTANEFKKSLLDQLNKMSDDEINEIKNEYNTEGDYGITSDGQSYWIPPVSPKKINNENKLNDK